jgi:hypothetical protein
MQFSGLNLNSNLDGDAEVIEVLSQSQESKPTQSKLE